MLEIEKIEGRRVLELFDALLQDGTPLKVFLSDKDFEHLNRIVDISTQNKKSYFLIDYAQGFENTVLSTDGAVIDFEFTDKDNIKYSFRTSGTAIFKGKIWLKVPQWVEREQRRKQFRISAPAGSKIFFSLNNQRCELKLIDISLGGSLGVLAAVPSHRSQYQTPRHVKHLKDVELFFPRKDENVHVIINLCEVKRLGLNPVTNQYEYGLEFQKIDNSNTKTLTDLVFRFQREFLRKRLRIDAYY